MVPTTLLALVASAAPLALAQGGLAATGFEYLGCVESPGSDAFPMRAPTTGAVGSFTVDACQKACESQGATYAALGYGGCFCDDPQSRAGAANFKNIAEENCHTLCNKNDAAAGRCGACDDQPIYNLYKRTATAPQAAKAVAPEPCDDESAAPAATKLAVTSKPAPATLEVARCWGPYTHLATPV